MAEAEAEVGVELDSAKRARRRACRARQMQRVDRRRVEKISGHIGKSADQVIRENPADIKYRIIE